MACTLARARRTAEDGEACLPACPSHRPRRGVSVCLCNLCLSVCEEDGEAVPSTSSRLELKETRRPPVCLSVCELLSVCGGVCL